VIALNQSAIALLRATPRIDENSFIFPSPGPSVGLIVSSRGTGFANDRASQMFVCTICVIRSRVSWSIEACRFTSSRDCCWAICMRAFAIGVGIKINTPMMGQGDYLQAQVRALRYVFHTPNSNWDKVAGRNEGFGELNDAIYGGTAIDGAATGLGLTSAWSVNAAYEHFWNLRWRSSLYGGYAAVGYGSRANAMLFEVEGAVLVAGRRQ
jgi:hypothetical protein